MMMMMVMTRAMADMIESRLALCQVAFDDGQNTSREVITGDSLRHIKELIKTS